MNKATFSKKNNQVMDLNRKAVQKNAFRITKERYVTCIRIRVPGGHLKAEYLSVLQEIANAYGNGTLHITTRQGFEIPGIPVESMEDVNSMLAPIMEGLDVNTVDTIEGYPAAGTRNIAACIGNRVCPKAQYDTTKLAKKIEKEVFPNDFHFKIAITGCPNDCQKVRMHDFGIIGMAYPVYDRQRCVSCNRCVEKCKKLSTGALHVENYQIVRDHEKCIGCGECVLNCPMQAWSRSEEKYYRLTLMGRTGKKNPRLGEDFALWIDEDSIVKIIKNTYDYVDKYIDRSLPKEHIGYIVDRTGFMEYKNWILKDVELRDKCIINDNIYWSGIQYPNYPIK